MKSPKDAFLRTDAHLLVMDELEKPFPLDGKPLPEIYSIEIHIVQIHKVISFIYFFAFSQGNVYY